jgi:hypothetical protein
VHLSLLMIIGKLISITYLVSRINNVSQYKYKQNKQANGNGHRASCYRPVCKLKSSLIFLTLTYLRERESASRLNKKREREVGEIGDRGHATR